MGQKSKLNEFEPVSYESWRELVARDLEGAPFEKKLVKRVAGIDIEPLYAPGHGHAAAAGLPGFAPYTRGSWTLGGAEMGWDVRAEVALSRPDAARDAILDELNGGATSIALVTADSERGRGLSLANLADLETVLEHVPLERVPVSVSAGAAAFELAAALVAVAEERGTRLAALHGSFGADPLGTLAALGVLPSSLDAALEELAALALWTSEHAPGMRAVTVNTSSYHEAGADAATDIGIALATGVAYLRALTAAGLSVSAAARQIGFEFSVGRDFFVEIAKLRAARRTWARAVASCGGDESAQAMVIRARTSFRTKTQRDPWVNLLRATAESFSAAAGGADVVTTSSFDEALGESDEFARRMARNTQHLLRHESSVHRVVDPAGGSYYVESITEELAQHGWRKLQELERAGGMAAALAAGTVQAQLAEALAAERKAVETRRLPITGVNEFPFVAEEPVRRSVPTALSLTLPVGVKAIDRARLFDDTRARLVAGESFTSLRHALATGSPAQVTKLRRERLAQPFESLRDVADGLAAAGERPKVFLANLGPIADHKARAGFAQNFFEAGGFAVLGNDGFASAEAAAAAFAKSGARLACLCASDATYAELAEATARALTALAPRALVLAGAPGERESAYRAAGVSDFIFVGTNACQVLRSLLERAGAV
jgi:methylmalonyl-CoA mutase